MPPRHSDHENILISHVYIMDPLVLFLKVWSGCSRPVSVVHNLRTHRLSPLEVTAFTDDQDIVLSFTTAWVAVFQITLK